MRVCTHPGVRGQHLGLGSLSRVGSRDFNLLQFVGLSFQNVSQCLRLNLGLHKWGSQPCIAGQAPLCVSTWLFSVKSVGRSDLTLEGQALYLFSLIPIPWVCFSFI